MKFSSEQDLDQDVNNFLNAIQKSMIDANLSNIIAAIYMDGKFVSPDGKDLVKSVCAIRKHDRNEITNEKILIILVHHLLKKLGFDDAEVQSFLLEQINKKIIGVDKITMDHLESLLHIPHKKS